LPDAPLLQLRAVSAGYGGEAVVADVDLAVCRGDFVGLLGANGSGKSTLLRAASGQIRLLDGAVLIGGFDLAADPAGAKQCFGYAVDAAELPTLLTPAQYFAMVASIRGCAADAWPEQYLPAMLAMSKWLNVPIGACSLGTRTKISIAAALLGAPALIILDESLNGLDPVASFTVKRLLQGMAASGRHAVILSTHMLEAVGACCTRAVFLQDGRVTHAWESAALAAARGAAGGFEALVMTALAAAP
jgi:ABC-2 type transport system ATP-binding protein